MEPGPTGDSGDTGSSGSAGLERSGRVDASRASQARPSEVPLDTPEPTGLVCSNSLGGEALLGGGAMADTTLCTVDDAGTTPPVAPDLAAQHPSYRAALVSSTTAALAGALAVAAVCAVAVATQGIPVAAAVGVVALVPAALVDLQVRRLPNRMVFAAAVALVATLAIECVVGSIPDPASAWADAALGAALLTAPLFAMHLVSPWSMGFGDVKAAVVLGAALGLVQPQLALVSLMIGSAATATVGLVRRRRHLPFGPGLVAGAAVTLALSGWSVLRFETVPTAPSADVGSTSSVAREIGADT